MGDNHSDRRSVRFVATGDTNIQHRRDPSSAFALVKSELDKADLVMGDCEGCFADASVEIEGKPGWHHSDRGMVAGLKSAGYDVMWCANNVHYGREAILSSLDALDEQGIAHVGAGPNFESARRPAILERNGVRFGFLAYSSVFFPHGQAAGKNAAAIATAKGITYYQPHPRVAEMPGAPAITVSIPDPEELEWMRADIRALRPRVDVLVIGFHWGVSGSRETAMYQTTLAHEAIDSGADLILGQHPHVPQGIEIYRDKVIFYSLGNFAFDWEKMRARRDGLLVCGEVKGGAISRIAFVPLTRNDEGQPYLLSLEAAGPLVRSVTELSAAYGTVLRADGDELVVWAG